MGGVPESRRKEAGDPGSRERQTQPPACIPGDHHRVSGGTPKSSGDPDGSLNPRLTLPAEESSHWAPGLWSLREQAHAHAGSS